MAALAADTSEESHLALQTSASFFEKFELHESQELLANAAAHWMLSTEDFRLPTDPPLGIITTMQTSVEPFLVLMMPVIDDDGPLDMELDLREIHQVQDNFVFVFNDVLTYYYLYQIIRI